MREGFRVGADTEAIVQQCPPDMEPERFCLCLMTLREVGLLSARDGSIYGAGQRQISGKADLEATQLIRSLRSFL
jgi:hypothetical protein